MEKKPSGLSLRLGCAFSAAAESWASIGVNTRFSRLPTPNVRVVRRKKIRMMAGFKLIGFIAIRVPSPSVPRPQGQQPGTLLNISPGQKRTSPLTRTVAASGIRSSDFDSGCSYPHGQAGLDSYPSWFAPFLPFQSAPYM
jgi:hypothetical protein